MSGPNPTFSQYTKWSSRPVKITKFNCFGDNELHARLFCDLSEFIADSAAPFETLLVSSLVDISRDSISREIFENFAMLSSFSNVDVFIQSMT